MTYTGSVDDRQSVWKSGGSDLLRAELGGDSPGSTARKGSPNNDWPGCFAECSDAIAAHIGKKRDLVVAAFSTTGLIERAASEIVLMSAMKNYFNFRRRQG